jgi:hypothetical protein
MANAQPSALKPSHHSTEFRRVPGVRPEALGCGLPLARHPPTSIPSLLCDPIPSHPSHNIPPRPIPCTWRSCQVDGGVPTQRISRDRHSCPGRILMQCRIFGGRECIYEGGGVRSLQVRSAGELGRRVKVGDRFQASSWRGVIPKQ